MSVWRTLACKFTTLTERSVLVTWEKYTGALGASRTEIYADDVGLGRVRPQPTCYSLQHHPPFLYSDWRMCRRQAVNCDRSVSSRFWKTTDLLRRMSWKTVHGQQTTQLTTQAHPVNYGSESCMSSFAMFVYLHTNKHCDSFTTFVWWAVQFLPTQYCSVSFINRCVNGQKGAQEWRVSISANQQERQTQSTMCSA